MSSSPTGRDLLCEIALAHISRWEPQTCAELLLAVLDDFGTVSIRTLQRALVDLVAAGDVVRLGEGTWTVYLRADSPRLRHEIDRAELVSDQIDDRQAR